MGRRARNKAGKNRGGRKSGRGRDLGPPEPKRPEAPPPHPLAGPLGDEPAPPGWSAPEAPGDGAAAGSGDAATAAAADAAAPAAAATEGIPHGHAPVMVAEVLDQLAIEPGDVVVDLTAGRGGHAARLAAAAGPDGTLILVDADAGNLAYAAERAGRAGGRPAARIVPIHTRFDAAPAHIASLGLQADAVLADLGFASTQVDDPARGLSFSEDGPLDMRLDQSHGPTVAEYLRRIPEIDLMTVIREYGEEPFARRIAGAIVAARESGEPVETTGALADLVRTAYGARAARSRLHPATRTFMALRIAVNGELEALDALLEEISTAAPRPNDEADPGAWLAADARIAMIAFHSLEDRAVKRAFRSMEDEEAAKRLVRKPLLASDAEVRANARARSARLRAITLECVMD